VENLRGYCCEPSQHTGNQLVINYLFVVRARHCLRVIELFTRLVALIRACRALLAHCHTHYFACRLCAACASPLFVRAARLVRVLSRAVRAHRHTSFAHGHTSGCVRFLCAPSHVTRVLFARVALVVVVLFVHLVHVLFTCVVRVVRTRCHTSFVGVTRAVYTCRLPCHASLACILRVDHVCGAASARDNKLFSLINTHVSNVNSSGHIF
jgi:hypothetical protein